MNFNARISITPEVLRAMRHMSTKMELASRALGVAKRLRRAGSFVVLTLADSSVITIDDNSYSTLLYEEVAIAVLWVKQRYCLKPIANVHGKTWTSTTYQIIDPPAWWLN